MAGKVLQQIVGGPSLDPLRTGDAGRSGPASGDDDAPLLRRSPFREDSGPPPSMQDIATALEAKRAEQRASLKRLAALLQEACDILNAFDA